MHKSNVVNKAAVLLLMAGLFIGCSKTETPVSTTTTVTVSKMALCWIRPYESLVDIISDPTPDISQSNATLSWNPGPTSLLFQDKWQYAGWTQLYFDLYTYFGSYHQFLDTVLTLKVTSNVGNCQGSIQMPESTYINAPSDGATLPIGNITCSWATAARAEWYSFYFGAYAFDSSYNYLGSLTYDNPVALTTSVTIPGTFFNYSGASYYYVYFDIYPEKGPKAQSGSTGNMTGTIKGFLVAEGDGDGISFYVGTPPKGVKTSMIEHKVPSPKERMDKYLQMVTGQ